MGARGCVRRSRPAMGTRGSVRLGLNRGWRAMGARGCARTSRRMFGTRGSMSVVARDAVEWGMAAACRVLPAVTLHAPAHGEERRRRAQADEVQEVVTELLTGARADRRHRLDRAMTRLAPDRGADVRLVGEV